MNLDDWDLAGGRCSKALKSPSSMNGRYGMPASVNARSKFRSKFVVTTALTIPDLAASAV